MNSSFQAFCKKVRDREFGRDTSWKSDLYQETIGSEKITEDQIGSRSQNQWLYCALNENLAEADSVKFCDGYFQLHSGRGLWGKFSTFIKRALRKLLKIFFGWYIFPLYNRRNFFNGKVVNVLQCQRDLLVDIQDQTEVLNQQSKSTQERVEELVQQNRVLQRRIDELSQENKTTQKLAKQRGEMLEWLYREKQQRSFQMDDDFYHDFEERFRGSRELILDRLKMYVPIVHKHLPDWSLGHFVDIGSGRGEWLDILRDEGATDYVGVDLNERQNAISAERGHPVVCADCLEYLTEQPANSIDLITGFQIIEHLPLSVFMELLKSCYYVLKPGGMILFETQNPQNLIVGADMFYVDPSHIRPIEPKLTEFLVDYSGFQEVRIIPANSCPNWQGVDPATLPANLENFARKFNEVNFRLFGPQDYAVFAVKHE